MDKMTVFRPQLRTHDNWEIAASFGSVEAEYWALKNKAGLLDLSHRGRILVRGKDAPRFLHGMVTNDVQGLKTGEGHYAFFLNVQGHILADARILRLEEQSFLLDTEPQSYDVIVQTLDRHIIADVVELEDCRGRLACFAVEGPLSRQAVSRAVGGDLPGGSALEHIYREDLAARIVHASLSGEEGFWILASPDRASELVEAICGREAPDEGSHSVVRPVGFDALEVCRIEAGIPRYGIDISQKSLPQETGQMQAISFQKGCYIGQEVVERIRSRGHVNRMLVRLLLEGRQEVPPEASVEADGKTVGFTGSSAFCFGMQRTVALGYLRREYGQPGTRVTVGTLAAEVAPEQTKGLEKSQSVGGSLT